MENFQLSSDDILKIVLVIGIIYIFINMYKKSESLTNVSNTVPDVLVDADTVVPQMNQIASTPLPEWLQAKQESDIVPQTIPQVDSKLIQPPALRDDASSPALAAKGTGAGQLSTADLLPKYDEANQFAQQNPVSKLLQEQNFITAGYHMGINTQIQSNKIAYLDLRSAPVIPKQNIGPFLQSSYEEPLSAKRRQFEIL
jgi:hypothetical protein